jgi:polar amino acid transport system substrate-binding protein
MRTFIVICVLTLFVSHAAAQNSDLRIITGDLPPYSYQQDARQVGVATDILREVMQRVGCSAAIEVRPWARAIMESLKDKTMSYPLARLPYREDKYCWIGPLLEDRYVFAVLSSNPAVFKHIDNFKDLPIGVNRGAPTAARLEELGFTNLQIANEEKVNPLMLFKERITAWYSSKLIITHTLKNSGFDKDKIKIAFSDIPIQMYIAASLNLKSEAAKWQKALDEMKSDGTYRIILEKNGVDGK